MSYIKNHLIKDEEIINVTKPHWVLFLLPGVLIVFGIYDFFSSKSSGMALLVIGAFFAIRAFIWYSTSEYGITNKRFIAKFGFIKRVSIEIMLNKVEGFSVDQSILGRLLGYGTIKVNGVGGTKEPIPFIPNPMNFRRIAQECISETESKLGRIDETK